MSVLKLAAGGLVLFLLGACSMLPQPDYRPALVRECGNADKLPWAMVDSWNDGDAYMPAIRFNADGSMTYGYDGSEFNNGRWSIDGTALHMDTNNHYADYDGAFDGATGSGTMKNETGNMGKWKLSRSCED